MHSSLDSFLVLDACVNGRDGNDQERWDRDSNQGEERSQWAVGQVAQANHPQTIGAGADLADGDRLRKVGIVGPGVANQVLVQAGQIAKAARREERGLQKQEKVDERVDHGSCSSSLCAAGTGAGFGEKKSAPRTIAARITTTAESLRRISASVQRMISALFFTRETVPSLKLLRITGSAKLIPTSAIIAPVAG